MQTVNAIAGAGGGIPTKGNWYSKYTDPNTDSATKQKLYGIYGKRYNWDAPTANAAAPAPQAAAPAAPVAPAASNVSKYGTWGGSVDLTGGKVTDPTGKVRALSGSSEREYLNPATPAARRTQLYNQYGTRYGWAPLADVLAGAPAATPAPAPTPEPTLSVAEPTPNNPQDANALYPYRAVGSLTPTAPQTAMSGYQNWRNFLPQDGETSLLYKSMVEDGEKRLSQLAAARGLSGSGREILDASKFYRDTMADEQQRQYDAAQKEASERGTLAGIDSQNQTRMYETNWSNLQDEAERLKAMKQDEALRLERVGNESWDRVYSLLDLLSQQSPMNEAYGATGDISKILQNYGDQFAAAAASGGGGGGGGGRSSGGGSTARPPTPPVTSSADVSSNFGGASTNLQIASTLGQLLGNLRF